MEVSHENTVWLGPIQQMYAHYDYPLPDFIYNPQAFSPCAD